MLTATQQKQVGNFDQSTIDNLGPTLGTGESMSAAGAVTLKTFETRLVVSGTMAFTLADGTTEGQRKRIVCESAAAIPAATLTIASPDTTAGHVCAATFFFDAPGQAVELVWTGTKWRARRVWRAGGPVDGVVVGTTVTTGKNLWSKYHLSVTGTASSTIAASQGIPDGNSPGEVITVSCSTAAAIPAGSIQMTGTLPGSATVGTRTLATFGATTNYMNFVWNGTGWVKLAEGVTVTYA